MNPETAPRTDSASISLSSGLRLEYHEQGPANGVPVVFLHGVTDSWISFAPVLRRLPPAIRAIAVTQRGHGDSGHPAAGYTYSHFSEDVREFLDALGVERAIIAGHSMGSLVAQRFAAGQPDRVAGLILFGAFSTLYQDPGLTRFLAASIEPLRDPIPPDFAREWQLSTAARPIEP